MALATARRRFSWLNRWWIVLLMVAGACLSAAAIVAAVFCHSYWGYILSPPPLEPRVLGATRLLAADRLHFASNPTPENPDPELVAGRNDALDLSWFEAKRNGDGALRLVPPAVDAETWHNDWTTRGVIAGPLGSISDERRRALPYLIESTADLVRGGWGTGFPSTRGWVLAYELLGPEHEPLLFVAVSTGSIANDHLAYYELLYDDSKVPPRLLDRRHWRFDVAGIESLEFAGVAMALSILFLALSLPPTTAILVYRRFSKGARVKRGRCPRCAYDLVGPRGTGCPECGWGRGDRGEAERDLRQYMFAGRAVDVLTRTPRWFTIAALAIAAILLWKHSSMPGGVQWSASWGRFLLVIGVCLALAKLVGFRVRPLWLPPHPRRPLVMARAAVVACLISLSIIAMRTDWPLRWRFSLSWPSLERAAMDARSSGFPSRAPVGMNGIAGLYRIGGIAPTSDGSGGTIVWVGGAGGRSLKRAFVWYPDGPPASPRAYTSPIKLGAELGPNWFVWNYER